MKHYIILLLLSLMVCSACQHGSTKDSDLQKKEDSIRNANALSVVLLPTYDALPLLAAQQEGVLDSLGLDVKITILPSLMDCDTMFCNGHADVAVTDMVRASFLQAQGRKLSVIGSTNGQWQLLGCISPTHLNDTTPQKEGRLERLKNKAEALKEQAKNKAEKAIDKVDKAIDKVDKTFEKMTNKKDDGKAGIATKTDARAKSTAKADSASRKTSSKRPLTSVEKAFANIKNFKSMASLDQQMVAISRHSASEYLSYLMLQGTGMDSDAVFRPQVHHERLRMRMLLNEQLPAAILAEPYASVAKAMGDTVLFSTVKKRCTLGAVMVTNKALEAKEKKIALLIKAYNLGAELLSQQPAKRFEKALETFHLPKEVQDTLTLPIFQPLGGMNHTQHQQIIQWMKQRGDVPQNYDGLHLFDNRFVK